VTLLEEARDTLVKLSSSYAGLDELTERIDKHLKENIEVLWHAEDVKQVRSDLDDEQCREVLDFVIRNYDPNNGITWETLLHAASRLYGEEE
jgi:hypothetical protein